MNFGSVCSARVNFGGPINGTLWYCHYWEHVGLHTASTACAILLLAIYPGQLQVMMSSVLFLLLVCSFQGVKHLGRLDIEENLIGSTFRTCLSSVGPVFSLIWNISQSLE